MTAPKPTTDLDTFLALDIRAGRVVRATPLEGARKPTYELTIDFGPGLGYRHSGARLTRRYTPDGLVGTIVLAVVNLPPRRIAGLRSEVLVLGLVDPADPGDVVLVRPDDSGGTPPAAVVGWPLA